MMIWKTPKPAALDTPFTFAGKTIYPSLTKGYGSNGWNDPKTNLFLGSKYP
jgi:hypothetical protein